MAKLRRFDAEQKLRAEREAGRMLASMPKLHGARTPDAGSHDATPSLDDLGINKSQSSRWQRVADDDQISAVRRQLHLLPVFAVLVALEAL